VLHIVSGRTDWKRPATWGLSMDKKMNVPYVHMAFSDEFHRIKKTLFWWSGITFLLAATGAHIAENQQIFGVSIATNGEWLIKLALMIIVFYNAISLFVMFMHEFRKWKIEGSNGKSEFRSKSQIVDQFVDKLTGPDVLTRIEEIKSTWVTGFNKIENTSHLTGGVFGLDYIQSKFGDIQKDEILTDPKFAVILSKLFAAIENVRTDLQNETNNGSSFYREFQASKRAWEEAREGLEKVEQEICEISVNLKNSPLSVELAQLEVTQRRINNPIKFKTWILDFGIPLILGTVSSIVGLYVWGAEIVTGVFEIYSNLKASILV
jgi:hypothetical protein